MPGALLRSGKLQEFKALGESGQPVHGAALQLREAIRLRIGRDAANCLAVPQSNETGDHIDWYAAYEGDVVPWSAATEAERADALAQLELVRDQLRNTAASLRGESGRELQIFGRLLDKVIYFPDASHVYLVDDKPVLTFWGFVDPQGASGDDPLGRLRPKKSPMPAAIEMPAPAPARPAPAAAAPITPVAPGRRIPWWWLLIPFLILLLLYLLRGCLPDALQLPLATPDSARPALTDSLFKEQTLPDGGTFGPITGGEGVPGMGLPNASGVLPDGSAMLPDGSGILPDGSGQGEMPALPEGGTGDAPPAVEDAAANETPPAGEEASGRDEPLADENTPAGETPKASPQPAAGEKPPESGAAANPQPPELPPLTIPPDALAKGSTDFLNGHWKAGAGIQDARTGKPMQLDYDFKQGKGKVKVRGGDGVECVGDVSAALAGGGLDIRNQGQAACSDGSVYRLPEVQCAPGARNVADCTGRYGENMQFPLSMKQAGASSAKPADSSTKPAE